MIEITINEYSYYAVAINGKFVADFPTKKEAATFAAIPQLEEKFIFALEKRKYFEHFCMEYGFAHIPYDLILPNIVLEGGVKTVWKRTPQHVVVFYPHPINTPITVEGVKYSTFRPKMGEYQDFFK